MKDLFEATRLQVAVSTRVHYSCVYEEYYTHSGLTFLVACLLKFVGCLFVLLDVVWNALAVVLSYIGYDLRIVYFGM